MKPDGTDGRALRKLLRWYPREWRERYGEEFLAMIEDTLGGRRPTVRLRVGVAWGGLRERGHRVRVRLTGPATVKRLNAVSGWLNALLPALVVSYLPALFKGSPPAARAWLATAARDALIAVFVLAGLGVLAGALVALPAFGRFLRAGGWPKIRRKVAWAAGATAAAAGGLTGSVLASRGQTYAEMAGSWADLVGFNATALALAIALWLWGTTAIATARHLHLAPRVRAVEKMLATIIVIAILFMVPTETLWDSAIQSSALLLFMGLGLIAAGGAAAPKRMRLAARRSRRLWSRPAG